MIVAFTGVVILAAAAAINKTTTRPSTPEASASSSGSSVGHPTVAATASEASPSPATTALPEPTLEPAEWVAPAPDDVLVLAGRDGVPGLLTCAGEFAFDFDALRAPTGAENGDGAEYDVLRSFLDYSITDEGRRYRPAREVARYEGRVAFLIDRTDPGPWGVDGGPYLDLYVDLVGGAWRSAGGGDCQPQAVGPAGYGAATWALDPEFRRPRPSDRVVHILVSEFSCSSGRSATGRIGPAYVITDRYEVHIEILVQALPGGQDCQAAPPTPATLRLPEPLGDRGLRDTNAHMRTGAGG